MTNEDEELDLLALVEEASLGKDWNVPAPTADTNADTWISAGSAGIPQREAPPSPWAPRQPREPVPASAASPSEETPVASTSE